MNELNCQFICGLIFLLVVFGILVPTIQSAAFQYYSPLDVKDDLSLAWNINADRTGAMFQFCYHAPTKTSHSANNNHVDRANTPFQPPTVMGIGFSKRGETKDADIFVIWRIGHKWLNRDTHTNHDEIIRSDAHQDYQIIGVTQKYSEICVTFNRKFVTCDKDDYEINFGTTHVLSFVSYRPLPLMIPYLIRLSALHPNIQLLQIVKSAVPIPPIPEDTTIFEMRVDKVDIPSVPTTYWCKTALLPELNTKHHIIRYEGVISPTSVGIVHHMEVFHCESGPNTPVREYNEPCNSETKPMGLEHCRKVIGAWAMGAQGLSYPLEAGFPIGGPGYSRHVVIEVHYNNMEEKKGLIDSSGIRFFIVNKTRTYDAGIMELGLEYNAKNSIPPGQPHFQMSGFCIPACTQKALPEKGIVIFGSQLHTHLTGIQVETRHLRGSLQLEDLNRDYQYSPHFQEIRLLQKHVLVKPGDALITTCTYNTTGRQKMTFGGLAITDEMCVNYVFYYPRIELEVCKSSLSDQDLDLYFEYANLVDGARTSSENSIEDNYSAIQWTKQRVEELEKFYTVANIHMSCNSSTGSQLEGNWDEIKPPFLSKSRANNQPHPCD